tara:strand:- start:462 stop:791 length:330 start_codon:yes stop_codon:yes gene_type:complete
MALKITLENNIHNNSLQLKDKAYFVKLDNGFNSSEKELLGEITEIGYNYIMVDSSNSVVDDGDFIMFSKNKEVNNNSLLGYYAEVKLTNNSTDKIELFSLGSEVTESSK